MYLKISKFLSMSLSELKPIKSNGLSRLRAMPTGFWLSLKNMKKLKYKIWQDICDVRKCAMFKKYAKSENMRS